MVPHAMVRQFAAGQQIGLAVAGQDVVLHESILPANYRWEDLRGLVPRQQRPEADAICRSVRDRFAFLDRCTPDEMLLLEDQTSHRERRLFGKLRTKARERSRTTSGSSPASTDV